MGPVTIATRNRMLMFCRTEDRSRIMSATYTADLEVMDTDNGGVRRMIQLDAGDLRVLAAAALTMASEIDRETSS
jgi:hypothetical protein